MDKFCTDIKADIKEAIREGHIEPDKIREYLLSIGTKVKSKGNFRMFLYHNMKGELEVTKQTRGPNEYRIKD